jgi:methionyl-tRNA formyltransferase
MRVIFFGTPQFAIPTLASLLECPEFEVVAVVTQPDKVRGRGNKLSPSPIKKFALERQISVLNPKRVKKDRDTLNYLQQASADVFVVVAYGQILSREILAMPRLGCVNVHGSILPKYRGAAPIQWSICNGEKETGITTMLMDEGMDTGAMLLKAYTPIGLLDNADRLIESLSHQGASLLVETLRKLERGAIEPIAQNNAEATYAPLIQKSDYAIDWSQSAIAIHNRVRGLYPNCIASFREQTLKIMATVPLGEDFWSQLPPQLQKLESQWQTLSFLSGAPGEVVSALKSFGPVVSTGEGLILLQQVQLAGKPPRSGWDFINGTRLSVGEVLGNGKSV